jgi:hypothetical protein
MKNIASSRVLYKTLKEVGDDVDQMMLDATRQMSGVLTQYSVNGVIPTRSQDAVLDACGSIIGGFFSQGRKVFAADGVTPLTRFASILNYRIALAIIRTLTAHTLYLQKRLPDDVLNWLATARPFTTEQVNIINPLAGYDAPHTWVDPNGYRLSDRIWWRGQSIRLKIDALLTDGIRSGRSALQMSKDLEAFLMPSRKLRRTNKPYGTDASYHAMVLARSEISRAASEASFAASRANPFVSGMDWRLSASHPKIDICDSLATINMAGERVKDPYPLDSAPMVVADSHPQCCTPEQMVETLRGAIPIETVIVGDEVFTHEGRYCRVLSFWKRPYTGDVIEVTTTAGQFTVTPEHPVLTEYGSWVNASTLRKSVCLAGSISVLGVRRSPYNGLVYNLHVDDDNSYTVNGHVVHNCLCANLPAVTERADDVIAALRADLEAAKPAPLTPVAASRFMQTLVGDYLTSRVSRDLAAILGGAV